MSSVSNDNGRALEYKIVDCLLKTKLFSATKATSGDQQRDIKKYNSLKKDLKDDFDVCAPKIVTWILSKLQTQKILELDRLKDSHAHVADIQFRDSNNNTVLNLSIKNNHDDLKHPRPYSTAQACGFIKKSHDDLIFRQSMETISNMYRNKVLPDNTKFNQTGVHLIWLYDQVCDHHIKWLNSKNNSKNANKLFTFMVNTNFYKIKVIPSTKKISTFVEVSDFVKIRLPKSFKAYKPQKNPLKNHFRIKFDNNWEIDFRIHNASETITKNRKLKNGEEKFSQLSLKFAVSSVQDSISPSKI